MSDIIRIPVEGLSAEDLSTVTYLELCMNGTGEKSMLARALYGQIAFGAIPLREVAIILGAYDPEGIALDDDADYDEDGNYDPVVPQDADAEPVDQTTKPDVTPDAV